jgi:hypothetical protein
MARSGPMESPFLPTFHARILEAQAALPPSPHLSERMKSRVARLRKGIISALDEKTRHEPAPAKRVCFGL